MHHPLWHKIPLVRLLIPFVCGILASMNLKVALPFSVGCFLLYFVTSVFLFFLFKQYRHRWFFGVSICWCMFWAGWALQVFHNELRLDEHYHRAKDAKYVVVKIETEPVVKPSGYKIFGEVLAVVDSLGREKKALGKLLVYVRADGKSKIPLYGDLIVIPVHKIGEISGPKNPDEFDYKEYLALKQVYFQAYLNAEEVLLTKENRSFFVKRWVHKVQGYVKQKLAQNIGSQNETGVAEALLYGYDKDIDAETKQAYSNTGTLHVLAVSGMHVGIIYMVLGMLLVPFNKLKKGKVVKQLIILISLWAYSFLCGMSPSILRATVMFSFIIVAGLMEERSNVYNTLAASVFVLLCFDPNLILNVGFQLSYLAVLGILFFQPFVASWYTAPNWFVHQVWEVTAVSLAAQVITFPISLFYFHSFPNCFLLSNLLMIPLTTLILYTGMVLLAVSWIPLLAKLLGGLLYYLILFTNEVVKWIEHIPYAYVNGIQVNLFQSILLYGIIILLTLFFVNRQKALLRPILYCVVVFCAISAYAKLEQYRQVRLVVFHIPKHNAIQWIVGNKTLFIADSLLMTDGGKMKFHLQQHNWKSGIQSQQTVCMDDSAWKKITWQNHTVVVAGKGKPPPLKCDVLLVPTKVDLDTILATIEVAEVILTSTVKPVDAARMMEVGKRKKAEVKFVGEKGAIQLSLPK